MSSIVRARRTPACARRRELVQRVERQELEPVARVQRRPATIAAWTASTPAAVRASR